MGFCPLHTIQSSKISSSLIVLKLTDKNVSVSSAVSPLQLPLLEKKRQLTRQLSEAQDLKEHIDRREQAVSRVLGRCLTAEQHKDYR